MYDGFVITSKVCTIINPKRGDSELSKECGCKITFEDNLTLSLIDLGGLTLTLSNELYCSYSSMIKCFQQFIFYQLI